MEQPIRTVDMRATIIEEDGTRTETTALLELGPETTLPGPGDAVIRP